MMATDIRVPDRCTNRECGQPAIEPIHQSSRIVVSGSASGPSMRSLHTTYRCARCGHTWGVLTFSDDDGSSPPVTLDDAARESRTQSRNW